MTNDADVREQSVKTILVGVSKKTGVIVAVAAAAVLIFSLLQHSGGQWWLLPVSIIFGGGLGLLNFRWLALAVQKIYLRQGATPVGSNLAAMIIHILKLSTIFIILFIVIKWQLLHVFALVAGLSLCFIAIIWEGATVMKRALKDKE